LFDRQEAREKRRLLDFVASNRSWKGGELAVIYTNPLTFLRKRRPLAPQPRELCTLIRVNL